MEGVEIYMAENDVAQKTWGRKQYRGGNTEMDQTWILRKNTD